MSMNPHEAYERRMWEVFEELARMKLQLPELAPHAEAILSYGEKMGVAKWRWIILQPAHVLISFTKPLPPGKWYSDDDDDDNDGD